MNKPLPNVGDKFEILVNVFRMERKFRMQVEVLYTSEQVIRFKLTGGKKEMTMEKILIKKTNPWKITAINFTFQLDDQSAAMAIMYIQDELDYQIKRRY
ncbi:MAG: hypothetical protein JNN00_17700 [Chitinophagaceae bacterium]|nr:hypothetical protein [Chitinophagaceae bacterium]